jgi:hypothetical protein
MCAILWPAVGIFRSATRDCARSLVQQDALDRRPRLAARNGMCHLWPTYSRMRINSTRFASSIRSGGFPFGSGGWGLSNAVRPAGAVGSFPEEPGVWLDR